MTNSPSTQFIALVSSPGDPPIGGAPPGAPPEGPPFQSALEAEWARTATAEGQQQSQPEGSTPTSQSAQGSAGSEGSASAEAARRAHRRAAAQPAHRHHPQTATSPARGAGAASAGLFPGEAGSTVGLLAVTGTAGTGLTPDVTAQTDTATAREGTTTAQTGATTAQAGAAIARAGTTTANGATTRVGPGAEVSARTASDLTSAGSLGRPSAHTNASSSTPGAPGSVDSAPAGASDNGLGDRAGAPAPDENVSPGGRNLLIGPGVAASAGLSAMGSSKLAESAGAAEISGETGSADGTSAAYGTSSADGTSAAGGTDATGRANATSGTGAASAGGLALGGALPTAHQSPRVSDGSSMRAADGSAQTLSTPGSPLAGEALPGGLGDSGSGVDLHRSSASLRERAGSGSHPDSSPTTPSAGSALSSTTPGGAGAAGRDTGWGARTGAHRPAEWTGLRATAGASAHDALWVPDPAESATGASGTGGAPAGGSPAGLAAASSAQSVAASAGGLGGAAADPESIDYGVGLQQAIEDLHGTIQLAARQGLSQARIALHPEELGDIRIHLTQTADGLLARVTADAPAAAQALAAGHAELRQSLLSLGIDLARLHVGHHEQAAAHGGGAAGDPDRDGAATSGETSPRGAGSGHSPSAAAPSEPATDSGPETEGDTSPLPPRSSGALVDVLA
jgi:hypothetical protein